MQNKIILASASPRRRELLSNIGLDFEVLVDDSPENAPEYRNPEEFVMSVSKQKVINTINKITDNENNYIIIGADTVVVFGNKILGKPRNEADAFDKLKMLSNNQHEVYTGITIYSTAVGKMICDFEKTVVKFRELTFEEIQFYIDSKEPMDKAGAYGIQSLGALFVEKIEGDYFNVVGLPLCKLGNILSKEFDINCLSNTNN